MNSSPSPSLWFPPSRWAASTSALASRLSFLFTVAFTAPLTKAEIVLSADEEGWQALWRQYYASVNIPSRKRLRQMKGYMPVRYWKFMPEMPAAAVEALRETPASAAAGRDDAPRPRGSS